jgi:hypothetical protein
MLREDLHLFALPYGRGLDEGFTVTLEPGSSDVETLIVSAIPSHNYGHSDLVGAIRDYVESAIWFLAEGDLFLELTYFRDPNSPDSRPTAFKVDFLFPEMITRRFGRYQHVVPVGDRADAEPERWGLEALDPKRLVVGSLPRRARKGLVDATELIRAADGDLDVMSAFTTGRYGRDPGFDLAAYRRDVDDIVMRGTRMIGWTGRGLFAEGLLDPMKAWRAIQFARFVSVVRDAALAGLQSAIDLAGKEIGFEAQLVLGRVLTDADLDSYEEDLRDGTRSMTELFSPKSREAPQDTAR